jgi:predicted DsbA family dithiol-disulfide isomerase
MATLTITDFSDPACPFGWSAEPSRRRLYWLFGDQIEWRQRMVGLSGSGDEYLAKGFTPEMQAKGARMLSERHHMPIDTSERPRMVATLPACRAVVAVRLNEPARERAMFRRLQVHHFSGWLFDEPETIAHAARDAGIDPEELARWIEAPETELALEEDLHAARHPTPAALALSERLARWSDGWRYTCPSYEIVRNSDGAQLSVPGFQPLRAYEVAIANLAPELTRREDPAGVEEVLEWAGEPLATVEVAEVCGGIDLNVAREALGRVAAEHHVGFDGFWTLAPAAERSAAGAGSSEALLAGAA